MDLLRDIAVYGSLLMLTGMLLWCGVLITRTIIELRHVTPVRSGLDHTVDPSLLRQVAIVIPAHNEEHNIETLLRSLGQLDYPDLRFVLALDRCTDRTEEIARRYAEEDDRITIVTIDACPEDWAGKTHAAYQGVTQSGLLDDLPDDGWLLFTDADTKFDPQLVRASVQFCLRDDLGFLSLLSTLTTEQWFESVVQPVACAQLMQMYPIRLANRHEERRPLANGQFMLFRKDAYVASGTHERIRRQLLEDLAFARRLDKEGVRMGLVPAAGMLECRMYGAYADFRNGWKRIYTDCANRRVIRLRKSGRRLLLVALLTMLAYVVTIASIALGDVTGGLIRLGLMLVAQFAALGPMYSMQRVNPLYFVSFPASSLMVSRILYEAAGDLRRGRKIVWGGRQYRLDPR